MTLQARQETFDSLQEEWRALCPSAAGASVFMTPAWLRTWWDIVRQEEDLLLLAFRDGGRLAGIAPLMRDGDTVRFIAHSDICDFHDFLCAPGLESQVYDRLLDELDATRWLTIELEGLREGSPTLAVLPALAKARGFTVEQSPEEVSPAIVVPATWAGYLGTLDKKDRHELRRKLRRLESAGAVSLRFVGSEVTTRDVATFLDLLRASREEKRAFLTPVRERFFHALARSMAAEGHLKLFFLELDGMRVAAAFCFDYQGGYYLYNSGFEPRQAPLSVGLLSKALCLKDAIDKGKGRFDLLRGAETYKYHLGARDHWVHKLVIRRGAALD